VPCASCCYCISRPACGHHCYSYAPDELALARTQGAPGPRPFQVPPLPCHCVASAPMDNTTFLTPSFSSLRPISPTVLFS
jgi:hypothetical protein